MLSGVAAVSHAERGCHKQYPSCSLHGLHILQCPCRNEVITMNIR